MTLAEILEALPDLTPDEFAQLKRYIDELSHWPKYQKKSKFAEQRSLGLHKGQDRISDDFTETMNFRTSNEEHP